MDITSYDEIRGEDRPRPNEFDTFLPWACQQHQVHATIAIVRVVRADYVSGGQTDRPKARARGKLNMQSAVSDLEYKTNDDSASALHSMESDRIIRVITFYNNYHELIGITFEKNSQIPRIIFKIIGLILPFHTRLNTVTINSDLDKYVIYELKKWLYASNITDICLDNTFFPEANYDILLESQSQLRQLSLARCRINDKVCKNIASKLVYSHPGSLSLMVLNLSSNKITDVGAKYLGDALRSNRKLMYLNLADNMIGDDGAGSILNSLQEFFLTSEEVLSARSRHIVYLKKRNELIDRLVKELRVGEFEKKTLKRKGTRAPNSSPKKSKGLEKDQSLKSIYDPKSINNMDLLWYEKAQLKAFNMCGVFEDPYSKQNTEIRDDIVYCYGNNTLCYLNLAYNSLSYFSVKKILNLLEEQRRMDRKPKGLINVLVEGNYMPKYCIELKMIDRILQHGLSINDAKMAGKKKTQLKTSIYKDS